MPADLLQEALGYLAKGWSVFPVLIRRDDSRWAKEPLCKRPMERHYTADELRSLWPTEANGIGLECGRISGIMRLDAEGPVPWSEFGEQPASGKFKSVSGGSGWLMSYMDGATTCRLWKGGQHEELRVQSDGSYTVVPPSEGYEWLGDPTPGPVPRWLYDCYVERTLSQLERELRPTLRMPERAEILVALHHIPADDYDTWVQVGMALKSGGDDYLPVWEQWSKRSDKYREGECERKWATFNRQGNVVTLRSVPYWAERHGYKMPNRHEPFTDLGSARVLARIGEGRIKHSSEWGWLAWNGTRWILGGDAVKAVKRIQEESLDARYKAALASYNRHMLSDRNTPDFEAKRRQKHGTIKRVRQQECGVHMREARKQAEASRLLSCDFREFDQQPFLLNCPNGTLDLRTGELRDHDSADLLTQLCPTPYDPAADSSMWEQFVKGVLPDEDVRHFLQRFLGVSLTGDTTLQYMPVLHGCGANGKSTLVETVIHVLGEDYAMKAKRDLLMAKRDSGHPTSIARLYRKRFVACVETAEGGTLDEPLVKEMTGGDTMAARRMREDEWQFQPTHKVVLATNHKPKVRGTDEGIWRRLPLVAFNIRFADDDPNRIPDLKDKLKMTAPGVLRWLVEGCRLWVQEGRRLRMPDAVKQATSTYRMEQDDVGRFLEERVEFGTGFKVRDKKLKEAFQVWCSENMRRLTPDKLWAGLKAQGFVRGKGQHDFEGLRLREEEQ